MNVRALIKFTKARLTKIEGQNADNLYTYKVDVWHGDDSYPYHESAIFTKDELSSWMKSVEELHSYLTDAIKDVSKIDA